MCKIIFGMVYLHGSRCARAQPSPFPELAMTSQPSQQNFTMKRGS